MDAVARRNAAMAVLSGCWTRKPHKQFVGAKAVVPFRYDRKHVKGAMWSQCVKKRSYDHQRAAQRVADGIFAERGVKLRVYQCSRCGKYHLSKMFRHDGDSDRFIAPSGRG